MGLLALHIYRGCCSQLDEIICTDQKKDDACSFRADGEIISLFCSKGDLSVSPISAFKKKSFLYSYFIKKPTILPKGSEGAETVLSYSGQSVKSLSVLGNLLTFRNEISL